jgi:hypothetical protein
LLFRPSVRYIVEPDLDMKSLWSDRRIMGLKWKVTSCSALALMSIQQVSSCLHGDERSVYFLDELWVFLSLRSPSHERFEDEPKLFNKFSLEDYRSSMWMNYKILFPYCTQALFLNCNKNGNRNYQNLHKRKTFLQTNKTNQQVASLLWKSSVKNCILFANRETSNINVNTTSCAFWGTYEVHMKDF